MSEHAERLEQALARMHEPWGGAHCLDFANTLEPRGGPPPHVIPPGHPIRDELNDYDELVAWAVHKGTIDAGQGVGLLHVADGDSIAAAATLDRAHTLRDAIYRAFWSIAHGETPAQDDLETIAREYARAAANARLAPSPTGIAWEWQSDEPALDRPIWPVAWSAVDLLTTGDHRRIKVCPGPGNQPVTCAWLFYDTTKNASRRWCSMEDCGATAKAIHQAERRRARRHAIA
jgi:predicted RNA-binding Zn ribbon-like protein